MAKLTHIEDVERRNAEAEEEREMLEAQEALERSQQGGGAATPEGPRVTANMRVEPKPAQARPAEQQPAPAEQAPEFDPELEVTPKTKEAATERSADEEADFHGLSSEDSMSGMQIALIVLAAIILIAAILYVVNSWIHFV